MNPLISNPRPINLTYPEDFGGLFVRDRMECLLNNYVRQNGLIWECDKTYLSSYDLSVTNPSDFDKFFRVMYDKTLNHRNYNMSFKPSSSDCVIYLRDPTYNQIYFINDDIPILWNVYSISRVFVIPLGFFILVSGRKHDIKCMVGLMLEFSKNYDLSSYPDILRFFKQILNFMIDVLHMFPRYRYPFDAYRYLTDVVGKKKCNDLFFFFFKKIIYAFN